MGNNDDPEIISEGIYCRYCLSNMDKKAIICPICKSHQNRIRNTVVYVSSISGLVALIASALFYILTQSFQFYKSEISKPTIEIHDFGMNYAGNFEGTFVNPSDVDVYLSGIIISWRGGSTNLSIGENIKAHSVVHKIVHDDMPPGAPITIRTAQLATEKPVNLDKVYARAGFLELGELGNFNEQRTDIPCFWIQFRSLDAPDIENMQAFYVKIGKKLVMDHASGIVELLSSRSAIKQKIETNFDILFLMQAGTTQCRNLSEGDIE